MAGLPGISSGSLISQPSANAAITASTSSQLKAPSMLRTTSTFSSGMAVQYLPLADVASSTQSGVGL
jgi:hypothetical protein